MRMNKPEMMAFVGIKWKELTKCFGWVKRILTIENNYEDGMKLEPRILKRMEQGLRGTLLRSSHAENDEEKQHQNC